MRIKCLSVFILMLNILYVPLEAGYTLKNGWIVNADDIATMSAEDHFYMGCTAMENCKWHEAAKQFRIVTINFPQTPLGQEAYYYLGISYFNLDELDFANDALSCYLKSQNTPQYFEDALTYKFIIANKFRCGAKKRLFGTQQLPKWAPAYTLALEIFDEVIAALPCHELATQSLYIKGYMLWQERLYRDSIDVFQQLIRRFPKHELAPESYLSIVRVYLEQSESEFQNPDLLSLAQINVRRFQEDFPGDERLCEAERNLQSVKEVYARGLFDTGQFYERICKPRAAIIYYRKAISQFPDTAYAELCYSRLVSFNVCQPREECAQEPYPAGATIPYENG